MEVVDPDWELVVSAAEIESEGGLSYADAFCIATARRLDAPVWTGDLEIIGRARELRCGVVDLR